MQKNKGFTLLELLIVMAILAILITTTVILINPARQLAKARDTQREADIFAIVSLVMQYSAEHSGALPDTDGDPLVDSFPNDLTCIGSDPSCFNLAAAGEDGDTVVPEYTGELPFDPSTGSAGNTGYLMLVDENGRLTASASGETRTINLTR